MTDTSSERQPTHYTTMEGGRWHPWPVWVPFDPAVLERRIDTHGRGRAARAIVASPVDGRVPSGPLMAHSFAFQDPKKGFGKFPRWDCINGWTQEGPEVTEATISEEDMKRKFEALLKLPPSGTDFADFTEPQKEAMREFVRGMTPGNVE